MRSRESQDQFGVGERTPTLGTLEHLRFAVDGMERLPVWHKSQIEAALQIFLLPESLADFIFQNQTKQYQPPKLRNIPDKTAVIDLRHLARRHEERVANEFQLYAEYNYDQVADDSYVRVLGRRRLVYDGREGQDYLNYYLRLGLDSALNLDRRMPIEAELSLGEKAKPKLLFRTSSKEDKKAVRGYGETNPKVLIAVLHEVAAGFDKLLQIRDNF